MRVAVPAIAPDVIDVVARPGIVDLVGMGVDPVQGGEHLLVGEKPIAMFVVEIGAAVLEEDADAADRALADHAGIEVAAGDERLTGTRRRIADRSVAADLGDDVAERIGPMPGDSEGANRTAA